MKEPVDHVLRAKLPWRSDDEIQITECGYDATRVKTLTRAEFFARLKDYGRQRTAVLTCMTCSETVIRWATWDDDPCQALAREIAWESPHREDRGTRLRDELLAIETVVERHKDEFLELLKQQRAREEWTQEKAQRLQRRASRE